MASKKTYLCQILSGTQIEQETTFYSTYGYLNAVVIRVNGATDGSAVGSTEIHIIPSGSKHFTGGSVFTSAPTGSIGINQSGGSCTTMYLKTAATTGKWGAVLQSSVG